jgi:septal ring factor EnvC (AmiA/AmiB activator)
MRELLPFGTQVKPQLPLFLTSWVDKTSAQCMYTMTQTRSWSILHLKAGCWYIECGKTICPVEKENVKTACNNANPRGAKLGSDHVEMLEEANKADLLLLPKKKRNKIFNQRTRDAKKAVGRIEKEATRATTRALREAATVAEKEAMKAEKSGKSKAITPLAFLTETSTASPSQNPRKQDSSFAQLSMSRLQQITSPTLMDSVGGTLHVQEFFFSGPFLSTNAHFMQYKTFPKEWGEYEGLS